MNYPSKYISYNTTIIDYDIKYQSAISHGLKSMNGMVRNPLFGNPATQLAGVMFTSTHKEPGKIKSEYLADIFIHWSSSGTAQAEQSKMMKHFQNLYGPASLFCYVGDIFSFQSPFYYLPLRHPRWSRVINDHWSHLDMEGCGQTCSSLVWFCIQPGVYKRGTWFPGSMDPGTFPENNEKTYTLKQGCRI